MIKNLLRRLAELLDGGQARGPVADWGGKIEQRWRWAKMTLDWGRWKYNTDWQGNTLKAWWEWEDLHKEDRHRRYGREAAL